MHLFLFSLLDDYRERSQQRLGLRVQQHNVLGNREVGPTASTVLTVVLSLHTQLNPALEHSVKKIKA